MRRQPNDATWDDLNVLLHMSIPLRKKLNEPHTQTERKKLELSLNRHTKEILYLQYKFNPNFLDPTNIEPWFKPQTIEKSKDDPNDLPLKKSTVQVTQCKAKNCTCSFAKTYCTITDESYTSPEKLHKNYRQQNIHWGNMHGEPCPAWKEHIMSDTEQYWYSMFPNSKNYPIPIGTRVCHECHHEHHPESTGTKTALVVDDDPLAYYRNYTKTTRPRIVFKYHKIHKLFLDLIASKAKFKHLGSIDNNIIWTTFVLQIFIHEVIHHVVQDYVYILTKSPNKNEIRNEFPQDDEEKLCQYISYSFIEKNPSITIPNFFMLDQSFILLPPYPCSPENTTEYFTRTFNWPTYKNAKLRHTTFKNPSKQRQTIRQELLCLIASGLGWKKGAKYWPEITRKASDFLNQSPDLWNFLLMSHLSPYKNPLPTVTTIPPSLAKIHDLNKNKSDFKPGIKKHSILSSISSELANDKPLTSRNWFKIYGTNIKKSSELRKWIDNANNYEMLQIYRNFGTPQFSRKHKTSDERPFRNKEFIEDRW